MSIPPIPNNSGAVDLGEIKRRADERDAKAAAEQKKADFLAAQVRVVQWDRAMTRAFKGIFTAPERRRALARAYTRSEA